MAAISKVVRKFVVGRLLDSGSGFNYWVNQLAGGSDYPDVPSFVMVQDTNLWEANINEGMIESFAMDPVYPFITVWSERLTQMAEPLTPAQFSGDVLTSIDFYASFEEGEMPVNTEEYQDIAEDAILETFNRQSEYGLYGVQGLSYNNRLSAQRYPLSAGGLNTRQRTRFSIIITVPGAEDR